MGSDDGISAAADLCAALDRRAGIVPGPPGPLPGALAELPAGGALGVDIEPAGETWRRVLAWTGVPLAAGGSLRWGVDLAVDPHVDTPTCVGQRLLLPPHDRWQQMTALALKPVRAWVAARCGYRLQAAAGVRTWRWPHAIVIVSTCAIPVGGFLHGPSAGQRTSLALAPGAWQLVGAPR